MKLFLKDYKFNSKFKHTISFFYGNGLFQGGGGGAGCWLVSNNQQLVVKSFPIIKPLKYV